MRPSSLYRPGLTPASLKKEEEISEVEIKFLLITFLNCNHIFKKVLTPLLTTQNCLKSNPIGCILSQNCLWILKRTTFYRIPRFDFSLKKMNISQIIKCYWIKIFLIQHFYFHTRTPFPNYSRYIENQYISFYSMGNILFEKFPFMFLIDG